MCGPVHFQFSLHLNGVQLKTKVVSSGNIT